MDTRLHALSVWVQQQMLSDQVQATAVSELTPVSGDASFRRYFRCRVDFPDTESTDLIAVDAPPDKEDNQRFVFLAESFRLNGVNVPSVYAADFEQGFMLLSDFGDTLLLSVLNADNVNHYYDRALSDLLVLQDTPFDPPLAPYGEALLMQEMQLFPDWFLVKHLALPPDDAEQTVIEKAFHYLRDQALSQPQVTVHRDFHARNIMVPDDDVLGYIDFQDAVHGPVTYDLVSLVRDCYVRWPAGQVKAWALNFKEKLQLMGRLAGVTDAQFIHWMDTMGAQRHIKVAGIFSRLYYRDGKSGYLKDIPLTVKYLLEEIQDIPALGEFCELLETRWIPALCSKQPEAAAMFEAGA
ncbi:MAG: phosphotransferase [Ketobacteraceae bacterium]|nr:phosphotransferase [Ketobacteraceae bacterium]